MSNEEKQTDKKHPLEKLADFYENNVKKADKNGYAEKFKQAFKTFQKEIKQFIKPLTFENVKYLDGYFIFGMGTNSIVHFKIKEAPGWLFGIWWSKPKKYKNAETGKYETPLYVDGNFFCQYEDNIDKFKPTYSSIQKDFSILTDWNQEKNGMGLEFTIARIIEFIIKQPSLAFCQDYCGWNYNYEYHSKFSAWIKFLKFKLHLFNKVRITNKLNKKVIRWFKKTFKEDFGNNELLIFDRGENWSPQYQLVGKQTENLEPNHYSLFDENDEQDKKLQKKYEKLMKKCEKIADFYNFYWFRPIDDDLQVVDVKTFKKLQKEAV